MAGRSDDDAEAEAEAGTDPVRADETDDDWRFDVDEVGDDGVVTSTVERETIEAEHALFVVLGALAMVLVFVRLWTLV